jgi:hypothetical protein
MQFDEKRALFRKILYAGNFIKVQKSVAIYKIIMEIFTKRKKEIRRKNSAFFVSFILSMQYRQRIRLIAPKFE